MVARGRQVDLVLVRGEGAYFSEIPPGVRITVLNCPRVSQAIWALAGHFRRTRPKAILSALTHMNLATILAARLSGSRARLVISERNQISAKARDAKGAWQRALYRAVPWAYRIADTVVAVSGGVARDLSRFGRLPGGKIRVIHNPVFDPAITALAQETPAHPWFEPKGRPSSLLRGGCIARRVSTCCWRPLPSHARRWTAGWSFWGGAGTRRAAGAGRTLGSGL
jgi:hypothetical protein